MNSFLPGDPRGLRLERMLQKARAILAIPVKSTRTEIKIAYLQMVKYHHPDNAEDAMVAHMKGRQIGSSYTLETMRNAKDLLLKHLKDET